MNGRPRRNERLFAAGLAADIARAKQTADEADRRCDDCKREGLAYCYAEVVTLLYGDEAETARQAAERADRIGQLGAAVRIMAVRYGDARAQAVRAGAAWPADAEAYGAAVRAVRRRHQAMMRLTRALVTYAITTT